MVKLNVLEKANLILKDLCFKLSNEGFNIKYQMHLPFVEDIIQIYLNVNSGHIRYA